MRDGSSLRLQHETVYDTPSDLPALVRQYLQGVAAGPIAAVAFCGAGPIQTDGHIKLTNNACVLDAAALAAAAGAPRSQVVNDFEAVAHSLPALTDDQLWKIGTGIAAPEAPRVVIGAGTGLGVASLLADGADWRVLPGEGGHVDLAAVDDEEWIALQAIRKKHPRVKAEHVLSGPGLNRLYAACGGTSSLQGPAIASAAQNGDAAAIKALQLFTRWMGRFAGNLALTLLARGGVYIAGGIVPGWGVAFDGALFRLGFEDKAPFGALLAEIPAYVIRHPQPGLLGLARMASASTSEKIRSC